MSYDREVIKINPAYGSIHKGIMPSNYLPPQFDDIPNDFLDELSIKLVDLPKGAIVYFTLDGTEPSAKSQMYKGSIAIKATTTLKLLGVLEDGTKCPVQTRTFKKVKADHLVKAVQLPKNVEPGIEAVQFDLMDVPWNKLDHPFKNTTVDLDTQQPARTNKFDTFTLNYPHGDYAFGAIFRGYITVPVKGIYVFSCNSAEGSRLLIGDKVVVDNDGTHNLQERSGQVALEAGSHPIKVSYFHCASWDQGLRVRYMGPGIRMIDIPNSALSHEVKK